MRADVVFNQVIDELGLTEGYQKRYIAIYWEQLFGKYTAKHVKVINLEHKKLFLYCDDPAWSDTINLRKIEIMDDINKFAGHDLVRDILFVSKKTPRFSYGPLPAVKNTAEEDRAYHQRVKSIPLSDDELQQIRDSSREIEDEELRKSIDRVNITRKQLEKMRLADGWHPCPKCSQLTAPADKICFRCQQKEADERNEQIRKIIQDEPWLKFKDIVSRVDCTPYMVNKQRANLVVEAVERLDMDHQDNIDAVFLTMLHKQIPLSEIERNPGIVKETIKQLRHNIGDEYFNYIAEHPEESAAAKRERAKDEYKPKKEYAPKKVYTPPSYTPPEYIPGQQRAALKNKKKK